jgi:excisionase family DNA binding protein
MKEKLLTLKEVAGRLRVSERSVFRYIHSGKLIASKIGYWRISEKDLKQFLKKNSSKNKNND